MAYLTNLPPELLHMIASMLRVCQLRGLVKVNRYLYSVTNHTLYANDAMHDGGMALVWAVERKVIASAEHSIRSGAMKVPGLGVKYLLSACKMRYHDMVQVLLESGADPNGRTSTNFNYGGPLHVAIWRRDLRLAKLLLAKNANTEIMDSRGKTALRLAAESYQIEMLELLLDHGAHLDKLASEGRSVLTSVMLLPSRYTIPLHYLHGDLVTYGIIYQHDMISSGNVSASTSAQQLCRYFYPALPQVQHWKARLMLILFERGIDPNVPDVDGATALEAALRLPSKSRKLFMELLLVKGADVDIQNGFGETMFFLAVKKRLYDEAKLLLQYGASVLCPDSNGTTALHSLVKFKRNANKVREFAQLLIERGHPIDIQDHYGDTPLSLAVRSSSIDLAQLLVDLGANPDKPNEGGISPRRFVLGLELKAHKRRNKKGRVRKHVLEGLKNLFRDAKPLRRSDS